MGESVPCPGLEIPPIFRESVTMRDTSSNLTAISIQTLERDTDSNRRRQTETSPPPSFSVATVSNAGPSQAGKGSSAIYNGPMPELSCEGWR
jgi:hypothetical protein